jgi:hypothetical protein
MNVENLFIARFGVRAQISDDSCVALFHQKFFLSLSLSVAKADNK